MVDKNRYSKKLLSAAAFFALFAVAAFAQDDPPSRVARLNYMNGNVSMEPAGVDQWAPAIINRPFTIGDYLYADQSSVAELHMDNAVIRAGQLTSFGFLNLTDSGTQIKMTEGDLYFRIHDLSPNESFEVDTPNAAITLLRDGVYRLHVDANANTTFVFARTGEAEVTGGGQAFTLNSGSSASLSGTDQLAFDIEGPPSPDAFDNWCAERDAREARFESRRYVPPTVVGSEDLDDYGGWTQAPEYGPVWYPNSVPSGWAPYHSGHWAWIEPWGWTWVDDNPWGFAPFHYGRWVYWQNRWGWAPGPCARVGYAGPVIRPVYAPALVAFFGGAHWGVSVAIGGGGPSLGWVPLGWGEVYTPSYRCSPRYFNNVNVNNTRITNTTNITNVYNTVYVNKTVYNQNYVNVRSPNAVAAMPQSAFANGRPVTQAGSVVSAAQLSRFQPRQAALIAPPVAPTRQAIAPSLGRPANAPPARIMDRQVIARNTPPPAPASFAARQGFLDQHAGQPHDFAAMHQATASQARPVSEVRQVTRVQPVAVHQGERVGNVPPSAAPGRPQNSVAQQPNRAVPEARPGEPRNVPQQEREQSNRPAAAGQPAIQPVPRPAPASQPVHGQPPNINGGQPAANNAPAVRPQVEPNREATPNANRAPNQPNGQYQRPAQQQPRAEPNVNRPENPQPGYSRPSQERSVPQPQQQQQQRPQQHEYQTQPPARQQPQESQQPQARQQPQERQQPQARQQPQERQQQPSQRPVDHPQNAPHEEHGTPPKSENKQDADHKNK